ncbi:MAG: 30S ribosomal protein S7 [Candidatus Brocadiia bacterium]
MPKKFKSFEHLLKPDPRFNNKAIGRFINCIMQEGKKSTAQRNFYGALDIIQKKITDIPPVEVFNKAIDNVKPAMEVRSKRIGGATYQVPVPVPSKRQMSLAVRWIITSVRKKKGKPFSVKLADEIMAAYKNEGEAIGTKINVHKMAEANRAFAHFAWSIKR